MKKMPVLFVGHGNPMNALDKNSPFNQNFRQTTQTFEKPKAILMISAHWYSSRLQVTSGENPPISTASPKNSAKCNIPRKVRPNWRKKCGHYWRRNRWR